MSDSETPHEVFYDNPSFFSVLKVAIINNWREGGWLGKLLVLLLPITVLGAIVFGTLVFAFELGILPF